MNLWESFAEWVIAFVEWVNENQMNLCAMMLLILVGMLIGYGISWPRFEIALEEIKAIAQGG